MNAQPTVFPVGREMLSWVREGGRTDRASLGVRFLIGWQSFWFERNLALQRHLPLASPLGADPVFILGLWRSGTTFMHDLLGACPGMIYPATWQCMNPASFRLQPSPVASKSVVRPMDGFTVDTFSPQEDEFALLALGVPSIYRGFFDPRRLDEVSQWLDPAAWVGGDYGWVKIWREFLRGVANGKDGRILLKSPNHTFRIRALLEEFPNASYVWLVRDPVRAFMSNRKMWTRMFEKYALWDWDDAQLDAFLKEAFRSAGRCLTRAISEIPRNRLVVVDFDRFTDAPVKTIELINSRLSFGNWEMMKSAIAQTAAGKEGYQGDEYNGRKLEPDLVAVIEDLRTTQKNSFDSHGLRDY